MSKQIFYAGLILSAVLLGIVGYQSFVIYKQQDLNILSLAVLAPLAGLASFFSPCSFGLLSGLLAHQTRERKEIWRFSSALAIGATLFFLLMGVGIALGGQALFASIRQATPAGRILRFIVGAVLLYMAILQLEWRTNTLGFIAEAATPFMRWQVRYRQIHPYRAYMLLGFAYPIAGFG